MGQGGWPGAGSQRLGTVRGRELMAHELGSPVCSRRTAKQAPVDIRFLLSERDKSSRGPGRQNKKKNEKKGVWEGGLCAVTPTNPPFIVDSILRACHAHLGQCARDVSRW